MNENDNAPQSTEHTSPHKKNFTLTITGLLIAISLFIISMFADSISGLMKTKPDTQAQPSVFDIITQEQTLSVARDIDNLCSIIIQSESIPYFRCARSYRAIDNKLQTLLLRQENRPLNPLSVELQKLAIENFESLRESHETSDLLSEQYVLQFQQYFHEIFIEILNTKPSIPVRTPV